MKCIERHASYNGRQEVWSHASETLACEMKFGVYLPEPAIRGDRCPVLYWLSGLACTEQNFITKAGAQQHASRYGVIVVAPDTSPRGDDVADDSSYDLGQGASFYVNATQRPWAAHYQMQDYVAKELPALVGQNFPTTQERGIFGHSMGGYGAIVTALRNPGRYRSVSAFAPIAAPTEVPWGRGAFTAYLAADREAWKPWDPIELIATARERLPLLVDQGEADEFLATQLKPHLLERACQSAGHPLTLRMHQSYDHSYYFIASLLATHFDHHAQALFSQRPPRDRRTPLARYRQSGTGAARPRSGR